MCEFKVQNSTYFINLPKINDNMMAPAMHLLANVVRCNSKAKEEIIEEITYDVPVADVMPNMIKKIASQSIVSTALCLLKQCLFYAFDTKAKGLKNTAAYLFKNERDGEIGFALQNKIPVSMKDVKCNSKVEFSSKDLVTTLHECYAGRHKNKKITCVHNLLLIHYNNGLAKHFFMQLCSH